MCSDIIPLILYRKMNVTKKTLGIQERSYWKLRETEVSFWIDYCSMKRWMFHLQVIVGKRQNPQMGKLNRQDKK